MKLELLDFKQLENYPSGSGIEFYDDKIYLVGDDARDLLVMDKKWNKPELVNLFEKTGKKTPKDFKSDLETITVLQVDKKPHLLILGSGSTEDRNKGLLFNLKNNARTWIDLSIFYSRLKAAGITSLNIEGIALVYDYLVLVNRGNDANPDNHLIVTKPNFWKQQQDAPIELLKIDFAQVSKERLGVTGLSYSDKHEDLFLTIVTENTTKTTEDGAIRKSYLAVIENLYRKIGREKVKIKVNQLIDLSAADKKFKGYNIESVCIQSEKDHSVKLQMIADNDTGKSYLFRTYLSW
jgi:hypothetical protein